MTLQPSSSQAGVSSADQARSARSSPCALGLFKHI